MYSAKETAEMTGLSTAALRYYEKEGLLPPIVRTAQKYRQYSDVDIAWIKAIQCLRKADVPIRSIRQYLSLLRQGSGTIAQRYDMVLEYKAGIEAQISDLQNALALAQKKLKFYQQILAEPVHRDMTYLEELSLFENEREEEE